MSGWLVRISCGCGDACTPTYSPLLLGPSATTCTTPRRSLACATRHCVTQEHPVRVPRAPPAVTPRDLHLLAPPLDPRAAQAPESSTREDRPVRHHPVGALGGRRAGPAEAAAGAAGAGGGQGGGRGGGDASGSARGGAPGGWGVRLTCFRARSLVGIAPALITPSTNPAGRTTHHEPPARARAPRAAATGGGDRGGGRGGQAAAGWLRGGAAAAAAPPRSRSCTPRGSARSRAADAPAPPRPGTPPEGHQARLPASARRPQLVRLQDHHRPARRCPSPLK
jgi:hypothetical protein